MKSLAIVFLVFFSGCNRESSPEGRMQIRSEKLEVRLDSLVNQNWAIMDSIGVINEKLKAWRVK